MQNLISCFVLRLYTSSFRWHRVVPAATSVTHLSRLHDEPSSLALLVLRSSAVSASKVTAKNGIHLVCQKTGTALVVEMPALVNVAKTVLDRQFIQNKTRVRTPPTNWASDQTPVLLSPRLNVNEGELTTLRSSLVLD